MRNLVLIAAVSGLLVACSNHRSDMAKADDRPSCLRDTGSRIPTPPGECNNQPGRSISREEMERTGAFTTFDAIRRVEPSAH
jgi:hypothetical protein